MPLYVATSPCDVAHTAQTATSRKELAQHLHDEGREEKVWCLSCHLIPELVSQEVGQRRLHHKAHGERDVQGGADAWTIPLAA